MRKNLRSSLRSIANSMLAGFGFELIRINPDVGQYIPFRVHQAEAQQNGMTVGDYIEARYDQPGSSQKTIDKLIELGVFVGDIRNICEIGPGSGRYLEKVKIICQPEIYHIYETASDWRDWLTKEYGVIPCKSEGENLKETETGSMDLVHAHKVFSTIVLYEILSYLPEMVRVVRVGGKVVFDVFTEDCIDEQRMNEWLRTRKNWPNTFIPKKFVIDYFSNKNFSFDGSFLISQEPLLTECFAFTKRS